MCIRDRLWVGFTLRCFQRLSDPYIVAQLCPWQNNWCARGTSAPAVSYTHLDVYKRQAIMGMDELSEEDKRTVSRARKVQRFLSPVSYTHLYISVEN